MHGFIAPSLHPRWRRGRTFRHPALCEQRRAQSQLSTDVSLPAAVAMPPVIFVLGGPGSGKGTQCSLLQSDYDLAQVCVGDLLRREAASDTDLGRYVAAIMQSGDIVPGEITMRLLKHELTKKAGRCEAVLIDGFPRAMDQARTFERVVTNCSFVLFYQCDEGEMIRRLLKRGKTSGRADDTEEVVQNRLKTYMDKTMPVIEHYRERGLLREIDSGQGTPSDVYVHTKSVFEDMFSSSLI